MLIVSHHLINSSVMTWVHELCHLWFGLHHSGISFLLTFPNFLPQWLVKRAIETKEEMGDYIRSYSISQFQKNYSLPEVSFLLFFSSPGENMSTHLETPREGVQKAQGSLHAHPLHGISASTWSVLERGLLVHGSASLSEHWMWSLLSFSLNFGTWFRTFIKL